eukprot:scaffold270389_cov43-Prasinocladus_malaysianus.AAC.1
MTWPDHWQRKYLLGGYDSQPLQQALELPGLHPVDLLGEAAGIVPGARGRRILSKWQQIVQVRVIQTQGLEA